MNENTYYALIKRKNTKGIRWKILIINSLSFMLFFMALNMIPAFRPYVIEEWDLSNSTYGAINGIAFIGYAIASLIGANIAEKIGTRKFMLGCAMILILSVASYPMISGSYLPLFLSRFITGIGGAGVCVVNASSGRWFPSHERGLALGIQGGTLGLAFAIDILFVKPLLALGYTWQQASAWMMIIAGTSIGLIHFFIYQDVNEIYPNATVFDDVISEKKDRKEDNKIREKDEIQQAKTWEETVRSLGFIAMVVHMMMNMLIMFTMATFLPNILIDVLRFDDSKVNSILTITFIATVFASPLGGILSDKVFKGRRWPICFISFFLCALCCVVLPFVHDFVLLVIILFVAYGAVPLENGPVWDVPLRWSKPEFYAKFNGAVMFFGLLVGGVFGNFIIGIIIDLAGSAIGALYLYIVASFVGMLTAKMMKI